MYLGIDIGRKKDHTVLDLNELVGDVFWNRLTLILPKVKFQAQRELVAGVISKFNVDRTCIAASGLGADLAEGTKDTFGEYRVEEVTFTNLSKKDMAVRTKQIFEDRRTRIAICRKLRDDLHNVKKMVTAAGNVRFDAERTKDGHSDRFWAKALAFMASEEGAIPQVIVLGA